MRFRNLFFVLVTLLLLTACPPGEEPAQEPTPPAATVTLAPTFTPVPAPEATPEATPTPEDVEEPVVEATPTTEPVEATPTVAPEEPTVDGLFDSPEYGVQAFMWWRPEVADRDLNLVRDMGFNWVKQDFAWREIEGAGKGIFDWSRTDAIVQLVEEKGLNLLVRLDRQPGWATSGRCDEGHEMGPPENMQDWADFVSAVATRYQGRVGAYAIWNEPNLAREWCDEPPDPEAYAELLRMAYEEIKAVDPDAIVISAGLTPTGGPMPIAMEDTEYLDRLYQAAGGSLDGYADVVGAHAPGFRAEPEVSPDEVMAQTDYYGDGRYFTFRRVEDLRAIMEAYGDAERQMAILEMGWTTDPRPDSPYHWHAVTEEEKADYMVRAFEYARENWSPWMGLMSLIYVCNYDWTEADEQYYWCITGPEYPETVLYPAYEALRDMPK
jgi:polysaccharide biosynthesis protein PslG